MHKKLSLSLGNKILKLWISESKQYCHSKGGRTCVFECLASAFSFIWLSREAPRVWFSSSFSCVSWKDTGEIVVRFFFFSYRSLFNQRDILHHFLYEVSSCCVRSSRSPHPFTASLQVNNLGEQRADLLLLSEGVLNFPRQLIGQVHHLLIDGSWNRQGPPKNTYKYLKVLLNGFFMHFHAFFITTRVDTYRVPPRRPSSTPALAPRSWLFQLWARWPADRQ